MLSAISPGALENKCCPILKNRAAHMLSSLRRLTRLAFNLGHVRGYVNYPTKGTCAVFHVDHFLLTSTRIKASDANSLERGGQRKQCATPVGGYEPCARAALITRMHAIPGFAAWVLSRDAKQFGSEMSGSSSSHTHTHPPTCIHAQHHARRWTRCGVAFSHERALMRAFT